MKIGPTLCSIVCAFVSIYIMGTNGHAEDTSTEIKKTLTEMGVQ